MRARACVCACVRVRACVCVHACLRDWFRESEEDLKPLFVERNGLYALWLSTNRDRDRKTGTGRSVLTYTGQQERADIHRAARRAVRTVTKAWFLHKALEWGRHGG